MPLVIPSNEAEELASEFARLTEQANVEAVKRAIRERSADELDEIALHCAALPVLNPGSSDEIVGYDDRGLPI